MNTRLLYGTIAMMAFASTSNQQNQWWDDVLDILNEVSENNPVDFDFTTIQPLDPDFDGGGSGNTPPPSSGDDECLSLSGYIDYSQNGANWCDQCFDDSYQQSPIELSISGGNILGASNVDFTIAFDGKRGFTVDTTQNNIEINFENTGMIQVQGEAGSFSEDVYYCPVGKMYLKSPAEHTFQGQGRYDAELQIEFEGYNGRKAMVSVFFDREGEGRNNNPFIGSLLLHRQTNRLRRRNLRFDLLFEDIDQYRVFHYQGSETKPPCSEGVDWYVINQPQKISLYQYASIASYFFGNIRQTQNQLPETEVYLLETLQLAEQSNNICGLFSSLN